ncbi:methyltransferase domain-containing protein [Actinopolymorpha sp. B11F2]|uniref:class I SAM-dependent methyltransferase n=1 Tax=Actinopolymorpha sp. B11F2 TaxID=3160862 RepID=UPI0032E3C924
MDDHTRRVQQEFARQASTFEDAGLNTAFTSRLRELVEFAAPEAADICVDVACGTGLVARALAPVVRQVSAVDVTPEMLVTGKRKADAEGLSHIVFQDGDAMALPFVDASFTLVVTRFSLHQVAAPALLVAELARVCRPAPDGRVMVADMVRRPDVPGDPDRIERLRDPSHGTMLTVDAIAGLLAAHGRKVNRSEVFDVRRPLWQWVEQAGTPHVAVARIEEEFAAELAGGPATGMRPVLVDGALWFTQTWAHILAA